MENKFVKFANQEDISVELDEPNGIQRASTKDSYNTHHDAPFEQQEVSKDGPISFEIQEAKESKGRRITDPYRLGRCIVCCYRNHNPRFTLGPHWPFSLCLLIFISVIVLLKAIFSKHTYPHWSFYSNIAVYLLFLFLFGGAVFVNQGIPDRNRKQDGTVNSKYCDICKLVSNSDSHHCEDCEVCVEDYDHHCPWTGKCIGGGNLCWFYGFVLSCFGIIIYMIVVSLTALK